MSEELLKTNLLTMLIAGGLLAFIGLGLYLGRDFVAPYIRYILPIPPLAVAAYVFAFNYFKDVNQSTKFETIIREVSNATLVANATFFCLSLVLILLISFIRQ
ncbi:MAG: hypothetical protein ACOYNY_00225 [Caldilineaceae bacterium]